MKRPWRFLKNLKTTFELFKTGLDKDRPDKFELWFQDESRFGLKTQVGRCVSPIGARPLAPYQHRFDNTYLWGSYSPVSGDSFVWEINGTDGRIFEAYLNALSQSRPNIQNIVVIDNAGFHSTKNFEVPENIHLLRIPPYSPELNPCEQIWQYIKQRFKNMLFDSMEELKQWLHDQVRSMGPELVKSITANKLYLENFISVFL
ncbi:IS630 family transposase [Maribacter sp. 2307ULW6-5]|uniref:IS630 family transposase n=1 Tax=Maribacter sp. 2307ULW6-5 TaxID=3386275 RepID=UPI0039BC307C